ncbi:PREDICTED: CTD nuclear envelope phosphatase 1 homolog [Drosophila arizonae]|uniref:CTD nuclear envelope phosphatase 1 homolog n=1 Tax=Drosophila arizonae TaxID=7263 RepID=A0ABM1P758_DROAR|nr:PREDICTED: CTD nuclear envelope phosphatase 1 homolog [Drosophila arizonae]
MDIQANFFVTHYYFLGTLGFILTGIVLTVPTIRDKFRKQYTKFRAKSMNYTPITYMQDDRLTAVSKKRLLMVRRKTLVLDMDETLISSVILYRMKSLLEAGPEDNRRYKAKSKIVHSMPYDYSFYIPMSEASVYVYKRPYVDLFLDRVSKWYNLVVFTAASEAYASQVLDFLDAGRNILKRRMFRQHCIEICGIRAKFVSLARSDLASVLLLDDCPMENSFNIGNSVNIKSYRIGSQDNELLCMLPFLDALRFTRDVRSVLGRTTRFDCLATCLESHIYEAEEDEDDIHNSF